MPQAAMAANQQSELAVYDNAQSARLSAGTHVGEVAQELWPSGVLT